MAHKMKYDYFKAFESQADIAVQEADLLIKTIREFTTAEAIHDVMPVVHKMEHEGDEINHATYTAIAVDFITPIDRDDIIELSQSLDDVIDDIEDVITLFYMMDVHFMHKDTLEMGNLIKRSCEAMREAVRQFPTFKKSDDFKHAIVAVNTYEEEADGLYIRFMHDLHTVDKDNPLRVLVWSRIFAQMEACNDACEHVADTMNTVLLKNS